MTIAEDKPLVWLQGELKTPPLSKEARRMAGFLLRCLQTGKGISMPHSRPMPVLGKRCHELRVDDADSRLTWRIVYRLDPDAIVIGAVWAKKTQRTPLSVIEGCKRRLRLYDEVSRKRRL